VLVAASLKESGNPLMREGTKQNKVFWVVEDKAMESGRDRHYERVRRLGMSGGIYTFKCKGLSA